MKNINLTFMILILVTMISSCTNNSDIDPELEKAKAEGRIYWMDLATAEAKMKKNPKLMMIETHAQWCGYCKRMREETYVKPDIINYINDNFYAVKFDQATKSTSFKGKEYGFNPDKGRSGASELAVESAEGRLSYPNIVFMDEQMEIIENYRGYRKASQFLVLLEFIKKGAYSETDYETYYKKQWQEKKRLRQEAAEREKAKQK